MTLDVISVSCFCVALIIFWIVYGIKEVKKERRRAPNGKVFVKEFVEMVDDINHAIIHCNLSCIDTSMNRYKFRVNVKEEIPYDGLEYETIPMYKNFAIYIEDEVVCRVHRIRHCYKDRYFIEFSSKRNRSEVIEILKEAYIEAKEHNYEYVSKLCSKFNSKSFYQDYSSSED